MRYCRRYLLMPFYLRAPLMTCSSIIFQVPKSPSLRYRILYRLIHLLWALQILGILRAPNQMPAFGTGWTSLIIENVAVTNCILFTLHKTARKVSHITINTIRLLMLLEVVSWAWGHACDPAIIGCHIHGLRAALGYRLGRAGMNLHRRVLTGSRVLRPCPRSSS